MVRWEYRVLHDLAAHELAELGDEGWEFVTVEFDDEGEILNALAKRQKSGGGGGSNSRRRRRRRGGGGGGGGGGSGQHPDSRGSGGEANGNY